MKITIGTQQFETNRLPVIGSGGEADILRLNNTTVLKLFKPPTHSDYVGNAHAIKAAQERILLHQKKLIAFPKQLPFEVLAPNELSYDIKGFIRGYTMPLVANAKTIWTYSQPASYRRGIDEKNLIVLFKKMYEVIKRLHEKDIILGDFNDLNVLVQTLWQPTFIDADSYQFGKFISKTFDERFVDPLLCILATPTSHPALCPDGKSHIVLSKPHTKESDWYAFATMIFQSITWTHPYGGVYRPKSGIIVPHNVRPIQKISVFHSDVFYPKKALPLSVLSDDVLAYFDQIFTNGKRGILDLNMLDNLRFTTCANCGTIHARATCPGCKISSKLPVTSIVKQKMNATRVFTTKGNIINFQMIDGQPVYLIHDNNVYRSNDGTIILNETYDPWKRFFIGKSFYAYVSGSKLSIVRNGVPVTTNYVIDEGNSPTVAVSNKKIFFIANDGLYTETNILGQYSQKLIANIISGDTAIWAGEQWVFGRYRAGSIVRHFFVPTNGGVINDNLILSYSNHKVIDTQAYVTSTTVFYFALVQDGVQRKVYAYALSPEGKVIAESITDADDATWSGSIRGKYASGNLLFSPTDEGIVRIGIDGNNFSAPTFFFDTKEIVGGEDMLYAGSGGMFLIKPKELWHLKLT